MRIWTMCVLAAATAAMPARADDGASRVELGAYVALFARYPGSMSEAGGALVLSTPVWLGGEHRFGQLRAEAKLLTGLDASRTLHATASLQLRGDLFLLDWLSFEVSVGPALGFQAGAAGLVPTAGLGGGGGYVFHLFSDRRRRVKLALALTALTALRSDPGNDCGMCAGAMGLGASYETPW